MDIKDVISELTSNPGAFDKLISDTNEFISDKQLNERDAALVKQLADRSRRLLKFTPNTLQDLAVSIGELKSRLPGQTGFNSDSATFSDQYTDNYADYFTDSYTDSDGKIAVDQWTKDVVLKGNLSKFSGPGGGFS